MKHSIKDSSLTVTATQQKQKETSSGRENEQTRDLMLSTCGFISQSYNFDLLFEVLMKLDIPWRFTWIGGIRQKDDTLKEDKQLLRKIEATIKERNWKNNFEITGWISDIDSDVIIEKTDIYLALFKNKISSAPLAKALGYRKKIITTATPLTQELVQESPIMSIVPARATAIIKEIKKFQANTRERQSFQQAISNYIKNHPSPISSQKLLDVYNEL
ncbi:MAG: glycosyltransferase [Chitinivibrionales bacterium]|nr:glycosyltransferase [Chitinivibrionales bacterium]